MSYNNMPRKPARDEWHEKIPDYETDKTADEIRNEGHSITYGKGGRWINNSIYLSINGGKSFGAVPAKLRTKDEDIPISPTDIKVLIYLGLIRKR